MALIIYILKRAAGCDIIFFLAHVYGPSKEWQLGGTEKLFHKLCWGTVISEKLCWGQCYYYYYLTTGEC